MGYDMYTVKSDGEEPAYFRANISGMGFLRSVMRRAGVDVETKTRHYCKQDEDRAQFSEEGSLFICFGSNDGWHVTPQECLHIAEKLENFKGDVFDETDWLPDPVTGKFGFAKREEKITEEDREYIQRFVEFCKKAATLDGFYVF
jgi:hypothetical protein